MTTTICVCDCVVCSVPSTVDCVPYVVCVGKDGGGGGSERASEGGEGREGWRRAAVQQDPAFWFPRPIVNVRLTWLFSLEQASTKHKV